MTEANEDSAPYHGEPSGTRSAGFWMFLIALAGLVAVMLLMRKDPQAGPAIGKPAPTIALIPLNDQTEAIEMEEAADGRITLLHFWGTWCGPCRKEYPELVSMVQEVGKEANGSFRFLSVSCEPPVGSHSRESLWAATEEFYNEIGVDVPTYCDPRGVSREAAAELLERPAMYYPTTVLIDQQGRVTGVWEGYSTAGVEQMRVAIEKLL